MKIIIHRGTQEIGGSCVEVMAGQSRILLDFGMPLGDGFGREFDERGIEGKSTDELIALGILYPVKGLYKETVPSLDAILVSHSHKDHYGFLKFAHPDIPVYASAGARKLIDVLNVFIRKEDRLQLPRAGGILEDRKAFDIGAFTVTPYLVDHSAFDAMSFLVAERATGQSLFYSGDFRAAGWKSKLFDRFVARPPQKVDCLLMEGTMMEREGGKYPTEQDVYVRTAEILKGMTGKVAFACCSGQNIDRIVSFYKAARKTGTLLVIDPYMACVLAAIRSSARRIPQMDWDGIRVFMANYYGKGDVYVSKIADSAYKRLLPNLAHAKIKPVDFAGLNQKVLVLMRTSMIPALEKIPGITGSKMIYSQWMGYLDKDSVDAKKFKAFVVKHGMDLEHVHTSGHATVDKLKMFADALNPRMLVPIHTSCRDQYARVFDNVKSLNDGVVLEVS